VILALEQIIIFAVILVSFTLITVLVYRNYLRLQRKLKKVEESLQKCLEEKTVAVEEKSRVVNELRSLEQKFLTEKTAIIRLHEEELEKLKKVYNNELSHRKSAEVRLGKISETLAPFLQEWPWNAQDFRFLGTPLDGIQFTDDEIIFVEIKTGKSRLTEKQRLYKNLILNKKISFAIFRLTETGGVLEKD